MKSKKMSNSARLAALGATVLLGGCYSYAPAPVVTTGDTFTKIAEGEHRLLPGDTKVLSLEQATRISLENNPDFNSKHHAITAAWATYYAALSSYFPTITGSYQFSNSFATPTGQINTPGYNTSKNLSNDFALQAQWTIFDGLMREMNMLSAKHSAKQSEAQDDDARRLLIQSVATAYNNVLLAKENIRIAQSDREFQEKQLRETQLKYDAGATPLSDVLNFQAKANDAEASLVTYNYSLSTAKYALAALMGLTEVKLPDTVEFPAMEQLGNTTLMDVGIYLDMSLANRPDLRAYREALTAAEYTLYSRWGAFSPSITANGSLGWASDLTRYRMREGRTYEGSSSYRAYYNNSTASYGVTTSWTIFDGTTRWANIRYAQAQVAENEFNVASIWITVISEVRQAYDNYIQYVKQTAIYDRNLKIATKQRDLVEEEYRAGSASLTRLNEVQNELVKAESRWVSSLVNVQNAKVQLETVTNSSKMAAAAPTPAQQPLPDALAPAIMPAAPAAKQP